MKRTISIIVIVCFVLAFVFGGIYWWSVNSTAPTESETQVSVVIPKGYSAMQIANILYDEGLIRNPLAFKIYVQFTGNSNAIQAGEYELPSNLSLPEIISELQKGPVEVWVTIPEGLRSEQVAARFANGLDKNEDEYGVFLDEFMSESVELEGYLFPDTYLFPKTSTATKVVGVLNSTFEAKINSDIKAAIAISPYSIGEIITMASLLERETITEAERPVVAGILWKRLEADWPLQVDAAVQYVVASRKCDVYDVECDWWPDLTKADISLNSPYNTYEYPGLPPSPIANPGLGSITAAATPVESEYWFYIHDGEGKIHYAETIEEHNSNIAKYLGK
jgi:UPF0755 protein